MLLAEQRGHLFFLVQGLSHIVSFSLLLFTLHIDLFSLRAIIFLSWALPGLASTCLVALCFKNLSWKGPIDWDLIFKAKQFFILALFSAFISLSDIWILSHTLSLEGVIQYNVLCKLFGVAAFAYAPVIHSLMPIFTSLFSQGNPKVVLYMLQKQCLYWIVAIGAFTVFILYICPRVESLFSITLAHTSIIAFGLYVTIRMIADFCITALQAKGILLPFFYLLPIQAALSICLQYTLSIHIGVTGLITGMALSYVCTLSWALPLKLKKASL
jgi:O-antigen/teichoic acid export membrane protein